MNERSPAPAERWPVIVPPRPALPLRAHRARAMKIILNPRLWLGAYVIALSLIALWPTPVDRGAGRLLAAITRVFPALTYPRIEMLANVVLFVPLGFLLALILVQRWLILPIAFTATVTIEALQAIFLDERTPSVYDIIANFSGACVGLLIVAFAEWISGRWASANARLSRGPRG